MDGSEVSATNKLSAVSQPGAAEGVQEGSVGQGAGRKVPFERELGRRIRRSSIASDDLTVGADVSLIDLAPDYQASVDTAGRRPPSPPAPSIYARFSPTSRAI